MFGFLQLNCRTALRRTLLLMALSTAVIAGYAQDYSKMSISTQMFLDEQSGRISFAEPDQLVKSARSLGLSDEEVQQFKKYAARPIARAVEKDGVIVISAFIRTTDRSVVSKLESLGVKIECEFLDGKLFTALIPVDKIAEVSELSNVTRISVATNKMALTDKAREYTNVDDVLEYSADAQAAGLPNAFDGSGVVLGVIDTGIDFNHIAFKDASGNSRIKQAYVYNGSSESTYTGSQITSNLTDDKSEDHGTHTSSTAGGSSVKVSGTTVTVTDDHANATYGGMAPGADLYLAGINGLNDTYLANAFQKICNYADAQGKPVVVSNSWGSQWGPHDGTGEFADICAQYFSDSNPNHICLFAASNDAGSNGFHVRGTATSSNYLGTVVQPYTGGSYPLYYGIIANACSRSSGTTLKGKIHVINTSTNKIVASYDVNPQAGSYSQISLSGYATGSIIAYRESLSSGKSEIVLQPYYNQNAILYMSSGYKLAVQFYPTSGSAEIDIWGGSNFTYFTNTPSVSGYTWTAGTDDGCYSDEATIPNAISIGAYASKNGGSNTSYTIGDIADFSSWGTASNSPTGLFYPWITAPGARLVAGVNHNHTSSVDSYSYYGSNYSGDLVVNSSTNPYAYMEGTSMATPTAAGIVALWLQAANTAEGKTNYPNGLTTSDVKTIMKETAITDSYTNGTNASHFGNGKINALAGIQYILPQDNPKIIANPTSLAFGDVTAGSTKTMTFNVQGENLEGNISLAVSGNNFSVSPTTVTKATAEGNGQVVTVTFSPTANTTANYTGTITLSSSNATSVTVNLTGRGVYTAPAITANPTSVTFTGNSGQTYTKTVTVTGTNLQGNISAAIQNDANGFYSVTPTSFNAASTTVTITWAPTAGGTSTANLVLTTTGTGANSVTVPLTGTAQGPEIVANPTSVTFTDAYATRTYTQTVTVTGTNLSQNITASISGANVYSIDRTSLSMTGGTITVTYAPTSAGQTTATLTLSSTGASTVTVPINGTAQAATPTLMVTPTALDFSTDLTNSVNKTFAVTGRFINSPVTLTLTDASGVFTLGQATIPAASISETEAVNVTVTFASTTEGNYTGTVTIASNAAESQTVNLTANASDGGKATDAYLNIVKYATIDEAGWRTNLVNNLYKYTEYDDEAWLTLPIYGAWVGASYASNSSTLGSGHPQTWISTDVSSTSNAYAGTTWNASSKLLGSSPYFTSATARAMGYNSRQNYTQETVTFFVTNTTGVQMLGLGQSRASSTYPATLKVYECTKNSDGTITASNTTVKSASNSATSGTFVLEATDLDATMIYKVEAATYRSYIAEIGFQTPLTQPKLTADPTSVTFSDAYTTQTYTQTVTVTGKNLTENITASVSGANVYSVSPTTLPATGGEVTITYAPTEAGATQATLTLSSTGTTATVAINGTAQAATPTLTVNPTNLTFSSDLSTAKTQSFAVTGRFISSDVTLTLTDASGVFTLGTATIPVANISETNAVNVNVTFQSATEGNFTGTVTVASNGAEAVTVNLNATANDGGTASDAYLNIAKYATIDNAGATVSGMETIYKYTEHADDDCAWLTVSNYGAQQTDANQNWFSIEKTKNTSNSWTATDVFLGDDAYFGSNTSYAAGWIEAYQHFYVTNCTQVKQYAYNRSNSTYPLKVYIYECTENADGTLTAGTTAIETLQNTTTSNEVLTSGTLEASKIYKISIYNDYSDLFEIGFQTPLNAPTLTASPTGKDIIAEPGEVITETITVTGRRLTEDVTVTITDENGCYSVSPTTISVAEALAGATVTVTFTAPQTEGSYRAQVNFTSGTATAKTVYYGAVGEKGSAYSRYLDIAKYSTVGTGNWYEGIFANAYKFTEDESNDCAWLTLPAAMPYFAWNYNDQNWCGLSSASNGGWYGHQWTATDVFQGYEFFKRADLADENGDYAHMMGGDGSNSTSNTTIFYGIYNVTNCTQVKAYAYNNTGVSSSYPAFIQIYELTENADGTLTQSETRTDIQTSTTSGQVTMTSAALDANKIYFVAVGGYRGFTYEVAFRTPLAAEVDLATVVVEESNLNKYYRIVDGDLTGVKVSSDGKTLYCKDANGKAVNMCTMEDGQTDYVREVAGLMSSEYDQSNWVALHSSDASLSSLIGNTLKGVKGVYTNTVNPTIELSATPEVGTTNSYTYNVYVPCNFMSTEQESSSSGKLYFFMTPKPMEVMTVHFAMWNGDTECFEIPTRAGYSNQAGLVGDVSADFSLYADSGVKDTLQTGHVYKFTGLAYKVTKPAGGASTLNSQVTPGHDVDDLMVYPLDGLEYIGEFDAHGLPTAVDQLIVGREVKSVTYHNVHGQTSMTPFDGVNIVEVRYTDGTRRIVKIMK